MNRLFAYGTLRPDQINAHVLSPLEGRWQKAYVRGVVHTLDWGPDLGLPALILNEQDAYVEGMLFDSQALEDYWPTLDEFEGFQYSRVQVQVLLETGEHIKAWTYQMNPELNNLSKANLSK